MISKVNGFPSPKDFDRWTDFVCCLGLAFSFFLSFFFPFFLCMNMTHARVALGKGEVGNRLTLKLGLISKFFKVFIKKSQYIYINKN